LSCYGSKINKTPNLDRIATGGMRFDNCFVTNSLCGPSRATLLTGKYSHMNGFRDNKPDAKFDGSQVTFPKLLQKAGYQTGIIGKWHLGTDPTGFDHWSVLPGQGRYIDPIFIENGQRKVVKGYATDVITDKALDFMKTRATEKPFCLLYHHKAPHRPWQPDEKHAHMYDNVTIEEPSNLYDHYEHRSKAAANAPLLYDVQTGLQAFCRGAGIDAERLPADAQTRLLHLAGQLFREALVGFKDLERTQSEIRNRFRIEIPPPEPDDPRPSLPRLTVEELLVGLLTQHESRSLDAVQWLRETVAEAKAHDSAAAQATRAAFVEFLDRLDPAELEARFERAARRGKARSADKAQYWDLFTTFYRNLIEMPADHLPHTFVEAFAAAYREFLKKPSP